MQNSSKMEHGKLSKQMKSNDPAPSQAAMDFINKAREDKPNGSRWPTTDELIEWNALEVVSIHMVFTEADLINAKRTFCPKLAHQIFGQKEMMVGYIFPKVHLYVLANSAKCFLKFLHEGLSNRQTDIGNARVFDKLISWLPDDYFVDQSKFIEAIKNENHTKMFGRVISEFELSNSKEDTCTKFIIRECSLDEPGFAEFHDRFQCLIVWYIDAANQLDLEDANWMFVYVYEEALIPLTKKKGYYPVGYCAIYKFFHYPDKIRTRIAQCFVLPCFQRMGIGFKLLVATYQVISSLPNAVDITVEDPCPAFQRLRDTVDSILLKDLDSYAYSLLRSGFTKRMMDDANYIYKINKRQCRRAYHILRMGYAVLIGDNEDYMDLLSDIQSFLAIPMQAIDIKPHKINLMSDEVGKQCDEVAQSSEIIQIPSAVDSYINEIRPVALRISELLKNDV